MKTAKYIDHKFVVAVKHRRDLRMLTNKDLAELSGVSEGTISMTLNGQRDPMTLTVFVMKHLGRVLKFSLVEMLDMAGWEPNEYGNADMEEMLNELHGSALPGKQRIALIHVNAM